MAAPTQIISDGSVPVDDPLDAAVLRALAKWATAADHDTLAVPNPFDAASMARSAYKARRKVDDVFGIAGFSVTPAWDIMLDLLIARAEKKEISTSSACIGAACPPTTGLRWLRVLEDQGLISKTDDANDGRRSVCSLTEKGVLLTEQALQADFRAQVGKA